ncbi:hypothetical protein [Pseudomonas sp. RIT357]|uniref:hypothetical protein n=1 Tax=Pseudomonas sp. RIT357 TaxID=1470593 RepID=UPI000447D76F|nr:hypothetical protein [Pseudomonas sp. RIT357]EZP62689.1 hypothetical protein BW43_05144 [Pseudomonas sp. RIT357]
MYNVICYFGTDGRGDQLKLVLREDFKFEDLPEETQAAHQSFKPQTVDLDEVEPHWFNGEVLLQLKTVGWYSLTTFNVVEVTAVAD